LAGGSMGGMVVPNLDGEIERCDGTEATTQVLLGEVITRPRLTEKLLSKPPFRFLHDVVMEVVRATGFGANLFGPDETDSAAVADKTQKMTFLEKIIKVVGLQLNTLVVASPAKIVAGRDPQDTNHFLQLLAVAAKNLPDSSAAVRTVLEELGGGAPAAPRVEDDKGADERAAPKQNPPPMTSPDLREQRAQEPTMAADDKLNVSTYMYRYVYSYMYICIYIYIFIYRYMLLLLPLYTPLQPRSRHSLLSPLLQSMFFHIHEICRPLLITLSGPPPLSSSPCTLHTLHTLCTL
jgi:hypothetical protein